MNHPEPPTPASTPTSPTRTRRRLASPVVVGLTALMLGGAALVSADIALAADATLRPSTGVESSDRDGWTLRERFVELRAPRGPEPAGLIGLGGGIRGEFVTPDGSGGYQTTLSQRGEVTAVSRDSITVKSEDDYAHTYVVTDATNVNATRDGINDVEVGHDVLILAVRKDGDDTAVHIGDLTIMQKSVERWDMPDSEELPALERPSDRTT